MWRPVGIHWAWNFTQGNIFGFEVSGSDAGVSLMKGIVSSPDNSFFAEAEGFEPPVRCRTTVFKTAAIDHSATPPERLAKIMIF